MPYQTLDQLPDEVRNILAPDEQTQWMNVFNRVHAETSDEQMALLAAWGALRKSRQLKSVKSADGQKKVVGWAVLFTDADNPDADDNYFDEQTVFLTDYYANAPLFMEHGLDDAYGALPIGIRSRTKVTRHGIWLEHDLHTDHPFYEKTCADIDNGVYTYSSDSLLHYVKQGFDPVDGWLGNWFLAGCSLTSDPAEPGLGSVTLDELDVAVEAVKSARARDARTLSGTKTTANENPALMKGNQPTMNEEMVMKLAEWLGVTPDVAAVTEALQALLAQLTAAPDAAAAEGEGYVIDMPMLKSALKMDDASDEEVAAALKAMLDGMTETEQQPEAEMSAGKSTKLDYDALASVSEFFAMKRNEAGNGIPQVTGQKKRQVGQGVFYNKGTKMPGLAELVRGHMEGKSEAAMKAMGYSVGATGGYFLRQETASEILELFRAKTLVAELGATFVPMRGIESLTYRKQLTGADAYYRGEAQTAGQSDLTFGTVNLNLKELIAATRPNRRLLRNSDVDLERMLRDDLQIALNLRGDLAALRGTGGISNDGGSTGAEPRGLRYTTGVTVTPLGTNGAVPDIEDFVDAWGRIEDANVPTSDNWGIAFSPRTKRTMVNLTDTTGQLLDDSRWSQGYKYLTTTQISNALTVGSSADCSEVYLGAWEYLIIGVGTDVEIIVDESVYRTTGEIYIEASMMHDVAVAQPVAFEILTGVRA